MDEPGKHYSQETDTRAENQTLPVLTHRWVLNNENTWTQGGEHYTLGSVGGNGWTVGVGSWGEIAWGEMPDIGDGEKAANHTAVCVPMQLSCMFFTCTPKPKMQLNKFGKKRNLKKNKIKKQETTDTEEDVEK